MADSGRDDNAGDKNGRDERADDAAGDTIRIVPVSWDDDSDRAASAEPHVPPAAPEPPAQPVPPTAADPEPSVLPAAPEPEREAPWVAPETVAPKMGPDPTALTRPIVPSVPAGVKDAEGQPQWIMWSAVISTALIGIAVLVGAGLYVFGGSGQAAGPGTIPQGKMYSVPDPASGTPQPAGVPAPSVAPSAGAAAGATAGDTSAATGTGASQGTTDESLCAANLGQIDSVIQDYYKARGTWPVTMAEVQRFSAVTPRCPQDDSVYSYNPYAHEVTCPHGHTAAKQ